MSDAETYGGRTRRRAGADAHRAKVPAGNTGSARDAASREIAVEKDTSSVPVH